MGARLAAAQLSLAPPRNHRRRPLSSLSLSLSLTSLVSPRLGAHWQISICHICHPSQRVALLAHACLFAGQKRARSPSSLLSSE